MKMGVSMIGGPTPIPYGLLFGGDKFMFFSLFLNENTVGEVRYGLACSDIISSTNAATPFSSTLLTPAIDQITQAVEDPFQSNALTDDEKYAVKIPSSKNGKQMLQQEAEMYEILSDLQGQCIPKIWVTVWKTSQISISINSALFNFFA